MTTPLHLNWPQGLSADLFLAQYWQQKPLLIRQAFIDFENPLSPDELGGLALDDEINSRLILQESADKWHLRNGPFTEQELTSLPAQGWSLLVSDIEKHLDGFQQYLQPFRFVPDWQIDDLMISYAPEGASVGPHTDEYDVFLLQASGKRNWAIDSTGYADNRCIPGLDIKVLQRFEATEQWLLEPGDMLYLPPGIPHHGVSMDNHCMTWSVGFRAISYADLLLGMAGQIADSLPATARFRDAAATLQAHPGEISDATLQALHRVWRQLGNLDPDQFKRMAGNVLTQRNAEFSEIEIKPRLTESLAALPVDAQVLRDSASRLAYTRQASALTLHADGEAYPVTEALACLLCDAYTYPWKLLREQTRNADNSSCILALFARGILSL